MGVFRGFIIFIVQTVITTAAFALQTQTLELSGDFLAAGLHDSGTQVRLAVFSNRAGQREQLQIEWFSEHKGKLQGAGIQALWDDTAGYDVCKFNQSDEQNHLLFLRPDGIYRLGASAPLVRIETLYLHSQRNRLTRVPICFSFGANGETALAVPVFKGVELWTQHRRGDFRRAATIPLGARMNVFERSPSVAGASHSQKVQFSLEYPELIVADFDGNSRKDICMAIEDSLECFLQKEDGSFDIEGSIQFDFGLRQSDEGSTVRYTTRLVDLNMNGRKDVVVTRQRFDLTNMKGEVAIFMQASPLELSPEPQVRLARDGFFGFQEFVDLDGNGYLDLVGPTVELGWTALAGIFIRRSASVQFVTYRNNGGEISTSSSNLHSMSFPVEFRNFASFLGALPKWDANFVGGVDGRQIMFFPGRSQIEVYSFDTERFRLGRRILRESLELGTYTSIFHFRAENLDTVMLIASPFESDASRKIQIVFPPSSG